MRLTFSIRHRIECLETQNNNARARSVTTFSIRHRIECLETLLVQILQRTRKTFSIRHRIECLETICQRLARCFDNLSVSAIGSSALKRGCSFPTSSVICSFSIRHRIECLETYRSQEAITQRQTFSIRHRIECLETTSAPGRVSA